MERCNNGIWRRQERLSGRSSRKLGASARRIIFAVLQYFRGELHLGLGQALAAATLPKKSITHSKRDVVIQQSILSYFQLGIHASERQVPLP